MVWYRYLGLSIWLLLSTCWHFFSLETFLATFWKIGQFLCTTSGHPARNLSAADPFYRFIFLYLMLLLFWLLFLHSSVNNFVALLDYWVRVNQRLYFPLSATDFLFPQPQCYVSMLPASGEGQKAESPMTLAESKAVGLPWPLIIEQFIFFDMLTTVSAV
jgi:hypothetical protein